MSTEPEAPKPEVITWDWKYSGDGSSRVMTSSKGETKGSKEYKYTTNGKVVWGYYADTSSLIGLVNDERAAGVGCDSNGNPLQPTLVGDTLTSVAKNRVLELTQNCSHTGQDTNSEVIGSGQPNAKSAFTAWCYSATHFKTIVNNDYTNAGAAGFWYDSDNKGTMVPYWTIVFNY